MMAKQEGEIWFLWRWHGFWPRVSTVHWKGYVLSISSLAVVAILAFASEKHAAFLVLYWVGAFVFVAIYWMLTLDHSKIDREPDKR